MILDIYSSHFQTKDTNDILVCLKESGMKTIAHNLIKFRDNAQFSPYLVNLERLGCNEGEGSPDENIFNTLFRKLAKCHKRCKSRFDISRLKRPIDDGTNVKPENCGNGNNHLKRLRSSGPRFPKVCMFKDLFPAICQSDQCLVAAGQQYVTGGRSSSSHVIECTEKFRMMATALNDTVILDKISIGDVQSNELWYHKICHMAYIRKFNLHIKAQIDSTDTSNENLMKISALHEVCCYIRENHGIFHKVGDLEMRYNQLIREMVQVEEDFSHLKHNHVTRFMNLIQQQIPSLTTVIENKVKYVTYVKVNYFKP